MEAVYFQGEPNGAGNNAEIVSMCTQGDLKFLCVTYSSLAPLTPSSSSILHPIYLPLAHKPFDLHASLPVGITMSAAHPVFPTPTFKSPPHPLICPILLT